MNQTIGDPWAPAPKVAASAAFLRSLGRQRIGLLATEAGCGRARSIAEATPNVERVVVTKSGEAGPDPAGDVTFLPIAGAADSGLVDALLVVENDKVADLMRSAEPLFRRGIVVSPADTAAVVPEWLLTAGLYDVVWKWAPVEYAARSGLKGHYVEFGTFWGRSFFPAYHFLREWMKGDFYAFDSFEGLSAPTPGETQLTVGDFTAGAYACNVDSFQAIAGLLGVDPERLKIVKGFYADTLIGKSPASYGLEAASVSICAIDCDLFEPTLQALEFVLPLLEPGALLYFDDWRLCRASPEVGERAAALEWLRLHPKIELVEFHREHWQHQWFIYHPEARPAGAGARWRQRLFRRR